MNVKIITDHMPTGGLGIGRNDGLHMSQKILLRAGGSGVGSQQVSGHHIPTENEGTGAVARVLKLAPLHFAGSQRQARVFALQRLHPSQFVGTHRPLTLFCERWGVMIDLANASDAFLALWIVRRGQPVADQMRLEIFF